MECMCGCVGVVAGGGIPVFLFNKITQWLKAGVLEPEDLGSNSDASSYKPVTLGKSLTSLCLYFTLNMG